MAVQKLHCSIRFSSLFILLLCLGQAICLAQSSEISRAKKLIQQGLFPDALELLENLTPHDSLTFEQKLLIGNCQFLLGARNEALEAYQAALQVADDSIQVAACLSARATLYTEVRQDLKAKSDFERALDITPSNPSLLYGLAFLFTEMGLLKKALPYYSQTISLGPERAGKQFWKARLQRGSIYAQIKECDSAKADLLAYHSVDTTNHQSYFYLGECARYARQPKAAEEYYVQSLALNPTLSNQYFYLGLVQAEQKKFSQALASFDEYLAYHPENDKGLLYRGLSHFSLGDKSKACEDWQAAANLNNPKAKQLVSQRCK